MGKGHSGSRRYAITIFGGIFALSLVGCGTLSLLPRQSQVAGFSNFAQLEMAYEKIATGTPASQLRDVGFDPASGDAEVLSYLGVVERFMPSDSRKFDSLAAPVKACLAARNRCTALVFRADGLDAGAGEAVLSLLGLARDSVGKGAAAAVTLFVQDGRVAYKMINGGSRIAAN